MLRRRRKINPDTGQEEVNLTPMIDVTFQLLIFFMVTSEMAKLDDIADLHLPKADAARPDHRPPKDQLVINILPSGEEGEDAKYFVGGDEINFRRLRQIIQREARSSKNQGSQFSSRPVFVRADQNLSYKHVQTVMQLLMDQRIWRLSFGAAPKEE